MLEKARSIRVTFPSADGPVRALLKEIESDLRTTEFFPENVLEWSADLWLESPSRPYLSTLLGLHLLNQTIPAQFFLQYLLFALNELIANPGSAIKSKLILVI